MYNKPYEYIMYSKSIKICLHVVLIDWLNMIQKIINAY